MISERHRNARVVASGASVCARSGRSVVVSKKERARYQREERQAREREERQAREREERQAREDERRRRAAEEDEDDVDSGVEENPLASGDYCSRDSADSDDDIDEALSAKKASSDEPAPDHTYRETPLLAAIGVSASQRTLTFRIVSQTSPIRRLVMRAHRFPEPDVTAEALSVRACREPRCPRQHWARGGLRSGVAISRL